MNRRQKEIQKLFLDDENKVLKKIEQNYQTALADINYEIERLLARDDANLQNVIYQIEYQKMLKSQVETILENLHNNEFRTVSEYLTKSYEDGFIGTMYDLQGQGVPLVIPIDQRQVVTALFHETKLSESLYNALGKDTKELSKRIASEISRGITNSSTYNEIAMNIANLSKIPKNNAMRIARTEAHRIQCKATADAQWKAKAKGADVVKQWDSSLDGKTRDTHRQLDGQIRELGEPFEVEGKEAMEPGGFGRPEEDCNCRCALLSRARWALGNDFTKWDQETGGLVKIKADEYDDFKRKYEKKSESVRSNVQKMNGVSRSAEELQKVADGVKKDIGSYVDRESKWSGKTIVDEERLEELGANGCKEWNCDITLSNKSTNATIWHEMLHSCSCSHYGEAEYISHMNMEEASVEFLCMQICNSIGIEPDNAYEELTSVLQVVNSRCNFGSNMEFAQELFNVPMPERYKWFESKVLEWMSENEVPAADASEIMDFIRTLS